MFTSCIQFSFHIHNYTSIIYTTLCTTRSASFSGTWTHVPPRSEITSDVYLQSPVVTWHIWRFPVLCPSWLEMRRTSQPRETETERERKGWHWLVLTLQWPCEGCTHGGGGGLFLSTSWCSTISVHMPNWDTPTHPLWRQTIIRRGNGNEWRRYMHECILGYLLVSLLCCRTGRNVISIAITRRDQRLCVDICF